MIQELPDISFERTMNHNYMILKKCDFFADEGKENKDFRIKMLLDNNIQGLIPVTHRMINGESRYYYEINSLQSLDRLYDKNEIKFNELKKIISGCIRLFDRLEEYLLDGSQIIIKPEYIYINVESMEPYFVCYPDYTGDVRRSFMEFIDDILTKIDHTDQNAVMLGYQIYRYTRNPNYVMSEIRQMLDHVIVDMAQNINPDVHKNKKIEVNTEVSDDCMSWPDMHYSGFDEQDDSHSRGNYSPYNSYDEKTDGIYEDYNFEMDNNCKSNHSGIFKSKGILDLAGMIFCVFIALSAAAIILGGRIMRLFTLNAIQELYLYGAIAMALVAAGLFLYCFSKKRSLNKEIIQLQSEDNTQCEYIKKDYEYENDITKPDKTSMMDIDSSFIDDKAERANTNNNYSSYYTNFSNETVCLGNNVIEERMLRGRVDGREINISLKQLPVTIGKLASFVDFAINDNAVSKMHARFEEHEGRVYLCDLNSTNGTVKNGMLIDINKPVALEPGDKLRFGRSCFTYC